MTEEGLSVFIENITTSTLVQPEDFFQTYNFDSGNYVVSFFSVLPTGDYRIFLKDDAGNQNEEGLGRRF